MARQSPKPKYIDPGLKPNTFFYWRQRIYQIEQPADIAPDPLLVWGRDMETAELIPIKTEALLLFQDKADETGPLFAPTLKQLQQKIEAQYSPPAPVSATGLPDNLMNKANQIVTSVTTIERLVGAKERLALAQGKKLNYTVALEAACAQLETPIGLTSYYKYRRLYRIHNGDPVRIAAGLRRKSFNQSRMGRAQLHFIDTLILRFYAGKRTVRLRPQALYNLARSTLKRTGNLWLDPDRYPGEGAEHVVAELLDPQLPMLAILASSEKASWLTPIALPSQSWFYGYLRWFEAQPDQGQAVIIGRHGQEMWEREFMVFDSFVQRAGRPLKYVVADHWLVDVFIVDEATRSRLDRLWLTLLLDAYSRSVLGLALLYEAPGIDSIQIALRHAIWPKVSHQALGFKEEWVCYGIPQQLYLDNAWGHHSHSLEQLARAISQNGHYNSIDLVFRPPYCGRYGALIERLFGNFSGQMKELLPGAILSSRPQHLENATRQACLLYQDVYRIVHQLIVRYQHTPHRELDQMTPHQKWLEGWQLGYGGWPPPLTEAIERLFWRHSPATRVINRKGISAFGLHYWSPELDLLPRKEIDGQRVQYGFSYDPANISCLAIFRDQRWVGDVYAKELRRADGSTRTISLWERQMAQVLARDRGQASLDWLAFVTELDELGQTRAAEKRQAKRQNGIQTCPPSALSAEDTPEIDYTALLRDFVSKPAQAIR